MTVFADYRLPQLLANWGIIRYHDATELAGTIAAGSELEVEIRSATIQAAHLLRQALQLDNSVLLDYLLWDLAKAQPPTASPYHRTRSIYY